MESKESSDVDVTKLSSFHLFPRLAPELRELIWEFSLLNFRDPPALWFFRNADDRSTKDGPITETNLIPFQDSIPMPMPLISFVNREARAVITKWADEQDYHLHFREESQSHILIRDYEPDHDILYLPTSKVDDFFETHWYTTYVSHDGALTYQSLREKAIAIPEAMVYTESYFIRVGIILDRAKIGTLTIYVVLDAPPDQEPWEGESAVPCRWELRPVQGKDNKERKFDWDWEMGPANSFYRHDNTYFGTEDFHCRMERIKRTLLHALDVNDYEPELEPWIYDEETKAYHVRLTCWTYEYGTINVLLKPVIAIKCGIV